MLWLTVGFELENQRLTMFRYGVEAAAHRIVGSPGIFFPIRINKFHLEFIFAGLRFDESGQTYNSHRTGFEIALPVEPAFGFAPGAIEDGETAERTATQVFD